MHPTPAPPDPPRPLPRDLADVDVLALTEHRRDLTPGRRLLVAEAIGGCTLATSAHPTLTRVPLDVVDLVRSAHRLALPTTLQTWLSLDTHTHYTVVAPLLTEPRITTADDGTATVTWTGTTLRRLPPDARVTLDYEGVTAAWTAVAVSRKLTATPIPRVGLYLPGPGHRRGRRRPAVTDRARERARIRAVDLYRQGLSLRAVADSMGTTVHDVTALLREHGVSPRARGRPLRKPQE